MPPLRDPARLRPRSRRARAPWMQPRLSPVPQHVLAGCNWLVADDDPADLCPSCRLTRTRPTTATPPPPKRSWAAEAAKRRLVFQLHELALPIISRAEDPDRGLAFDLLSSRDQPVCTGHEDGVITLDLSESDDSHRERIRRELGEPYRTVLGHLRHEIGHYYWPLLVDAARSD